MTGLFVANSPSNVRTEIYSKRAVTVFSQEYINQAEERAISQAVQFARQIAALKNVQTYSEPYYVMDMGRVVELMSQWKTCLPRVLPFYSISCNDDGVLLKLLANYSDVGFFCQSRQNMEKALEYVSSDRILYSNPMWTRSTLSQAMSNGVNLVSFESARDLDRILMNHPNAELLLRICVNAQSEDTNAHIGCDLDNAAELLQLAAVSGANCVGVSFTVGAGCDQQPNIYASAIESAAQLFDYGRQLGLNMNTFNLGGGFSHIQHAFPQSCEYINRSLDYYFPIDSCSDIRIIATPGRFFAGSPFTLVTNIIGRRSVDLSNITNDDFDSGREAFIYQTNESYYGPFGCRLNAIEPECRPLFDHYLDEYKSEHVYGSVVGPTFDDMDVVQQLCRFRPMDEGDWLIWQNMGAYTMNNKASLDDEEENRGPVVFYFASQKAWNGIEFSNGKLADMDVTDDDQSVPTTPVHSVCSDDFEDRSCGERCAESDISDSPTPDDILEEFDDRDVDEADFLAIFRWPFYE
ncbi:pyridoxal-dependent decarboxylase, pyridoxal binding domain-containing protein [Ditylenchus destructor]|uniref:Pyridoxal-dependent decarboxylase, pyridoxal binding domain-containing protein n=1 Tax=Ditylenchus destructor TaxID=166010 RepID=A0AAD4N7K2_9BILA|nr:pyridoxal-dependent decarboxylase, pyridoxal binding domain-containing protein [Ditylenchus destructor]